MEVTAGSVFSLKPLQGMCQPKGNNLCRIIHLKVLEEVCPLSARVIVNPVSMRMENDRIKKLIHDLRALLQEV